MPTKNSLICKNIDGSPLETFDIRVASDDKQHVTFGVYNNADDVAAEIKLVATHPIRNVQLPDVIPPRQTVPVSFDVYGADIWNQDAEKRARQFGVDIHCIWERRTGKV